MGCSPHSAPARSLLGLSNVFHNLNTQTRHLVMLKKQVPFQEPTPSAEPEDKALPVEPTQPPKADIKHRAPVNSAAPYEILARDGAGHPFRFWGINE